MRERFFTSLIFCVYARAVFEMRCRASLGLFGYFGLCSGEVRDIRFLKILAFAQRKEIMQVSMRTRRE